MRKIVVFSIAHARPGTYLPVVRANYDKKGSKNV